jgi:hypothetical protein
MAGIIAVIAMILNIVLLGAIAYFGITLKLPGIARDFDDRCWYRFERADFRTDP